MTEIFGTLGPACAQADILEKMFLEGMTGMRLNMSHSGLEESEPLIRSFQQAAQRIGIKPGLLIDMQGPEVRIGDIPFPLQLKESEKAAFVPRTEMEADAAFVLQKETEADAAFVPQTETETDGVIVPQKEKGVPVIPVAEHILDVLETGDHILLDDGRLELVITSVRPVTMANVIRGGSLQKRKSLKVIGKSIPGPAVTHQDRENIRLAEAYGVTALMQPFVTEGEQLLEVRRELLKNHMDHVRIFAKIENREGMENIKDIMPYADMVVIARGDLGNDMPLWELPAAQKILSEICRKEGKPFLVVTQLLASMAQQPYPTRAEVSDIFHAVADGAAAVMVTNETAVGKYPAEVIRYLKKTVQEAEKWRDRHELLW